MSGAQYDITHPEQEMRALKFRTDGIDGSNSIIKFIKAAYDGNRDYVEFGIMQGFSPNVQNKYGDTALIAACAGNQPAIVRYLLRKGADPNFPNYDGTTPLMVASYYGNIEIVNLLLVAGADVNIKNELGTTALKAAEYKGCQECIKALKEAGAEA